MSTPAQTHAVQLEERTMQTQEHANMYARYMHHAITVHAYIHKRLLARGLLCSRVFSASFQESLAGKVRILLQNSSLIASHLLHFHEQLEINNAAGTGQSARDQDGCRLVAGVAQHRGPEERASWHSPSVFSVICGARELPRAPCF